MATNILPSPSNEERVASSPIARAHPNCHLPPPSCLSLPPANHGCGLRAATLKLAAKCAAAARVTAATRHSNVVEHAEQTAWWSYEELAGLATVAMAGERGRRQRRRGHGGWRGALSGCADRDEDSVAGVAPMGRSKGASGTANEETIELSASSRWSLAVAAAMDRSQWRLRKHDAPLRHGRSRRRRFHPRPGHPPPANPSVLGLQISWGGGRRRSRTSPARRRTGAAPPLQPVEREERHG